jgi:photosystem II stability/assembly factor-like uncharacterized protein
VGGLPIARTVNGFAVSPTDPRVMYVATRDGLFRSRDAGTTWKTVAPGLRSLAAVAVGPTRPDEVYVATTDGAVHRSPDGGTTWARVK